MKQLTTTTLADKSNLMSPAQIVGATVRNAHGHLLKTAETMNLRAEAHSSVLTAVRLYDRKDRYLFSWIINPHHLLFYVRKPALKLAPHLTQSAERCLKGMKTNPAGEVTVRIESAADAEALTQWLFDPTTWTGISVDEPKGTHLPSSELHGAALNSVGSRQIIK